MSSAVVDVETTTTLDPSAMMPDSKAHRVWSLPEGVSRAGSRQTCVGMSIDMCHAI